jgi:hypothetical protein
MTVMNCVEYSSLVNSSSDSNDPLLILSSISILLIIIAQINIIIKKI